MADNQELHELHESQIVSEGHNGDGGTTEPYEGPAAGAAQDATEQGIEAPKKPRAKRASVKSVENRVAAIEQRVESFAQEIAQVTRITDQLARLNDKIAKLEESLSARSNNGGDAAHDGAGIADHVRQLDERLQKLAYVLAQQNWNRI